MFSPGPWYVGADHDVYAKCQMLTDDPQADDDVVAEVHGCGGTNDVRDANARLIAAAPEMFELLVEAPADCWHDGDDPPRARCFNCRRRALLARIGGVTTSAPPSASR